MKQNVGNKDAAIRVVLATVIALIGFYNASWWALLALIPLATAYFGFCPLYKLLGINTCKKHKTQVK